MAGSGVRGRACSASRGGGVRERGGVRWAQGIGVSTCRRGRPGARGLGDARACGSEAEEGEGERKEREREKKEKKKEKRKEMEKGKKK